VPHYTGFEKLFDQFGTNRLVVIAFPSAQFYNQEPGVNSEIPNGLKYVRPGGGFQTRCNLMSKGDVNGAGANPVFGWLTAACGATSSQFLDAEYISWSPVLTTDVTWNYNKWLLDLNGRPIRRYDTVIEPPALAHDIQMVLANATMEPLA